MEGGCRRGGGDDTGYVVLYAVQRGGNRGKSTESTLWNHGKNTCMVLSSESCQRATVWFLFRKIVTLRVSNNKKVKCISLQARIVFEMSWAVSYSKKDELFVRLPL